jgi:A/G-specific adenine glycosylase
MFPGLRFASPRLQVFFMTSAKFSQQVLNWFSQHGRKNLPWQKPRTPYRVWISEIMLQQTQVATVIDYFQRFIKRFPAVETLAAANLDDVLTLWAGLGYYSRARNLHRTAQIIQQQYHGKFPQQLEQLQTLPGIGRSTAGAIMALSMNKRAAILDGNVKRVLSRVHAVDGSPTNPKVIKQLWKLAEQYTPEKNIAEYTQAMMDLGATICTRSKPKCTQCPLQKNCIAYQQGNPAQYPNKKITKTLPVRAIHLLILQNNKGEIFLEKRPPVGIWGGLWSLPECPLDQDVQQWCTEKYFCHTKSQKTLPAFRHTFSHFHLDITPVVIKIDQWRPPAMDNNNLVWCDVTQLASKGLAAPVKQLLTRISNKHKSKNTSDNGKYSNGRYASGKRITSTDRTH